MTQCAPICRALLSDIHKSGLGASWTLTTDGIRLRLLHWRRSGRATIAIFPGRTEFAEKYADVATAFRDTGYDVAVIDWRGQGLSDRLVADNRMGHVSDFSEYQQDVDALLKVLEDEDFPRPYFLLAHSMGGTIGLRSLLGGANFRAAVFTGPMWGIAFGPTPHWLPAMLIKMASLSGLDRSYAPGQRPQHYAECATFDENDLTSDQDAYRTMGQQMRLCPELAVGGASVSWVRAALAETSNLMKAHPPACPSLTLWGSREQVVDKGKIRQRLADWTLATGTEIDGGRHEILFEVPHLRLAALSMIKEFFLRHATPSA